MKLEMAMTLDAMLRALKTKAHSIADDIERQRRDGPALSRRDEGSTRRRHEEDARRDVRRV